MDIRTIWTHWQSIGVTLAGNDKSAIVGWRILRNKLNWAMNKSVANFRKQAYLFGLSGHNYVIRLN